MLAQAETGRDGECLVNSFHYHSAVIIIITEYY